MRESRWSTWPEKGTPMEARPAHLIPRDTRQTTAAPTVARRFYRVSEIAAMSGLAQQTIYAAIYRGELESTKRGRAVLVPAAAVDGWLPTVARSER